jgi:hypothetical protein
MSPPLLFPLNKNDLEDFLIRKNVLWLSYLSEGIENELELYLKTMIMVYADDTVLMSEIRDDLQYQLTCFKHIVKNGNYISILINPKS